MWVSKLLLSNDVAFTAGFAVTFTKTAQLNQITTCHTVALTVKAALKEHWHRMSSTALCPAELKKD